MRGKIRAALKNYADDVDVLLDIAAYACEELSFSGGATSKFMHFKNGFEFSKFLRRVVGGSRKASLDENDETGVEIEEEGDVDMLPAN